MIYFYTVHFEYKTLFIFFTEMKFRKFTHHIVEIKIIYSHHLLHFFGKKFVKVPFLLNYWRLKCCFDGKKIPLKFFEVFERIEFCLFLSFIEMSKIAFFQKLPKLFFLKLKKMFCNTNKRGISTLSKLKPESKLGKQTIF